MRKKLTDPKIKILIDASTGKVPHIDENKGEVDIIKCGDKFSLIVDDQSSDELIFFKKEDAKEAADKLAARSQYKVVDKTEK